MLGSLNAALKPVKPLKWSGDNLVVAREYIGPETFRLAAASPASQVNCQKI